MERRSLVIPNTIIIIIILDNVLQPILLGSQTRDYEFTFYLYSLQAFNSTINSIKLMLKTFTNYFSI